MANSISKYTGRGGLLFPVLVFIFTTVTFADWNDFPGVVTGFYSFREINIPAKQHRPSIRITRGIDDIYRKMSSQTALSSVFQQSVNISLSIPYSFGKSSQILFLETKALTIDTDNLKDETAVHYDLAGKGTDSQVRWAVTDGIGILGIGIRYGAINYNTDITILEFPNSDDPDLNTYFLDFLPTAIGKSIGFPVNSTTIEIDAQGSTTLIDKRIGLCYNHLSNTNKLRFDYFHSSEKSSLNGKRRLDMPTTVRQNRAAIFLMTPNRFLSATTIELFSTNFDYETGVNSYGAVDMDDLGNGQFSRSGISLQSKGMVKKNNFRIGLSIIDYSGNFELKTPLLGYAADPIFGWKILPVAHGAEGNLGKSRSFSQLIGWSRSFQLFQTTIRLNTIYIHSKYNFKIRGSANLEFGLVSAPIDYPIAVDADIFDISGKIIRDFNHISVIYSGQQLLPFIKRTDHSPIKFHEPATGIEAHVRGGQAHKITLEYRF